MKKQFWSVDSILIWKTLPTFCIFSLWFTPSMRNLRKKCCCTGFTVNLSPDLQVIHKKDYLRLRFGSRNINLGIFLWGGKGQWDSQTKAQKKGQPLNSQSSGYSTQAWPQRIQLQVVNADSYNNSTNTVTPENRRDQNRRPRGKTSWLAGESRCSKEKQQ